MDTIRHDYMVAAWKFGVMDINDIPDPWLDLPDPFLDWNT